MVASVKKISFSLSQIFNLSQNFSQKKLFSLQRSLVESIGHAEEFSHTLLRVQRNKQKQQAVKEAAQHARDLKKCLRNALASTKYLRNKGKGENKYQFFDHLYGSCGLIMSMSEELRVPHAKSVEWKDQVKEIEEKVGSEGIIGCCSEIIDLLEAHNEEEMAKKVL